MAEKTSTPTRIPTKPGPSGRDESAPASTTDHFTVSQLGCCRPGENFSVVWPSISTPTWSVVMLTHVTPKNSIAMFRRTPLTTSDPPFGAAGLVRVIDDHVGAIFAGLRKRRTGRPFGLFTCSRQPTVDAECGI